jgi:hypothetical protein
VIDLYCERVGPGLWGEPANVLSNIAFVIAAWALWRLRRDRSVSSPLVGFFTALTMAIAIGSTAFHMLATPWARVLDEGPISLFQVAFLWCYGRRVMRWSAPTVLTLIAALLATTLGLRVLTTALNRSLPYFPALLLTFVFGIDHARAARRDRWSLLAGSALFVVAVCLRSIDNDVCASFPVGTHFLWHLLAGGVLYLFAAGLVKNSGSSLDQDLSKVGER